MDTLQRAAKPIWDKAESYVQTKLRCHCFLCSSLLRRYGDAGIRTSIQAHFDEYAFATAIVSLDKLSDFSGGLVVQAQPAEHSRRLVELDLGDLVLHSYDLLHSVDVQGGTRHSLIMWFSTSRAACHKAQTPWKRKYARLGEPNAQYQYARSLIFNSGEAAQGWRWLAQAASKGQSTAQLNWGLRQMQEGRRARAQHWWRRAARQGVKELTLDRLESLSYTWLTAERADYCKDVVSPPPKLDETLDYTPQAFDTQEGAESRVLLQAYRGENFLLPLIRACPFVDKTVSSECEAQIQDSAPYGPEGWMGSK
eukprot:g20142.t1